MAQWTASKTITVDKTSEAFFKEIYPSIAVQKYRHSDKAFSKILAAVTTYADSFVAISEKYTPADGSLAEQYNRDTGVPLSAVDLTWSYAAFVTMSQRRAGQYPASWGANKAAAPPHKCSATSTQGVYAPATAAGAPNVTASCQIQATFNVNASTYYGENIYIVGSTADLGNWDVANGYPLNSGDYTSARPLWDLTVALTAGETISYKYVRQEDCSQAYIYEAENRTLVIPPCGGAAVTTEDAWVGPVGTSGGC